MPAASAIPAGWSAADLPAAAGRTVVVTGATSGLGLVVAREFARVGAHVVLAVRDVGRGAAVAAAMPGSTEVRRLDLASLTSVREFAAGCSGPVDVLVANAGVMAVPYALTADGFETQFGVNHLGHFALTGLLLDRITDRVVAVSSFYHRGGRISFDDPNWRTRRYDRWAAYRQSKLANLLFVTELQRRLTAARSPVRALAAHPGYAATNLQARSGHRAEDALVRVLNRVVAQSADGGARPLLAAAALDLPGDTYVGPVGLRGLRGDPQPVDRAPEARDGTVARRLWEMSEDLTGVRTAV